MLYRNTNQSLKSIKESFFINLTSRKDRLFHFKKNVKFKTSRFNAFDASSSNEGGSLTHSEKACFRSHYELWMHILDTYNHGNFLIMEDDINFIDNFIPEWNENIYKFIPKNFNIIYLGGCLHENLSKYKFVLDPYNKYFNRIKKNIFFSTDEQFWHMTSICYLVNIESLKILVSEYASFRNIMPVDEFLIKSINKIDCNSLYHTNPLLCFSTMSDSDIKR